MENIVSEGINLMIFGMGFVVVFLTLLVFATTAMSKLVAKIAPEQPQPKPVKAKAAPAAAAGNNDELIAVMTAAVHKYRSN
ncbi:OadG family protein [Pontibacterium sp. N1Y112]|jgi:oxaloacetate decarboxylase gamma subunit|uniref:Probable oxaloacetate decarboxylase gamma chain n=1 Tax=Pontibacterium sinense TaxID=2781979 RepID=A0A8J7JXH6_9GAMM|nr:OadG family protein [Pontibacterium sinense]MBE9396348.1 OadG family protein [Pontibacterium sinense]